MKNFKHLLVLLGFLVPLSVSLSSFASEELFKTLENGSTLLIEKTKLSGKPVHTYADDAFDAEGKLKPNAKRIPTGHVLDRIKYTLHIVDSKSKIKSIVWEKEHVEIVQWEDFKILNVEYVNSFCFVLWKDVNNAAIEVINLKDNKVIPKAVQRLSIANMPEVKGGQVIVDKNNINNAIVVFEVTTEFGKQTWKFDPSTLVWTKKSK